MCAAGKPQNSLGADNGWQQKIPSPSSGIRELRLGIRGYHKKDAYHWRRLQCQQQWTGQNQDSCQILYCADWCHPIPTVVRGSLCQAFGEEGWSEIGKDCCVVIELDIVYVHFMPLPEDLNDDCFSPSFGWCQWCITNSADMSEWQVVFLLDDQDVSKTCFKHYFWSCIKYVNKGHCKVF